MYNEIENLSIEDKIRFICDRIDEIKKEIDQGKVWDNKVKTDRVETETKSTSEVVDEILVLLPALGGVL